MSKGKGKKGKIDISKYTLPEFVSHRINVWDEVKAKEAENNKKGEKKEIKVTLPDGSVKEGKAFESTPIDIARAISQGLANSVVVAKVNDEMWDLGRPLEGDCTLTLYKFDSPEGQKAFWHSSAHVLGQALERRYHGKLCVGPPLSDGGFYYDIALDDDSHVATDDFAEIQAIVNTVVKEKQPFERLSLKKEDALEMFKYSKYKTEIISDKVPDGEYCTAYRCGPLIDLCKGPHIPHTGRIKAFHIYQNSSAYWKGDAENDSLQRVYGISFPDNKKLKEWKKIREEAEARAHKKIGLNQELFFIHDLSPGSAFFLPHGTRIYTKLVDFVRKEYRKRGFDEIISPNIFNTDLFKISGHLEAYKENMFFFEQDGGQFGLKPMNCPGHCLVYKMRNRSYRELPVRFADFGALHRNELSGALHGLTRVRRFQQDDAHIFCAPEQVGEELKACIEFMKFVYGVFGFTFHLELSTRPEKKFIGDIAVWNEAEARLKEELNSSFGEKGWKLNAGDGAFYGPKIDVHVQDALKRSHQCATIQLDFNLPSKDRFNLTYQKSDGGVGRPVIIHRAIFGSVERFYAILIEHTAGKWPFWLSPRQCIVCSVSEKHEDYAKQVQEKVFQAGFHVDIDVSDKQLPKKVRNAQLAQYNYILVVGDKESESKTVNVRTRDNKVHGERTVEALIEEFKQMEKEYK